MSTLLVLSLSISLMSVGQVSTPNEPYTLHVYEDLVEVPTLVLTASYTAYPGLSPASFSATFDRGPVAHPAHVRLEGNDPVALALLFDVSQQEPLELAKALPGDLRRLPARVFNSSDGISVFADDCTLARSLQNVPASLPELSTGISDVLASPTLHRVDRGKPRCADRRRLWDVIATAILQLQKLPGRRVLFVVTDGLDQGSTLSSEEVKRYAVRSGVTIFGIRPYIPPTMPLFRGVNGEMSSAGISTEEDDFSKLCDGTGGLTFSDERNTAALTLRKVMEFVRHRYILDFQRPSNATAGDHRIDVRVPDATAVVRASGAIFPIRDQKLAHDPATVPTDLSHAPKFGDSKPAQPE